jgi:gas vesicle protein
MNDKEKFITGLILGGLAGAAITLFLSSNKGKEMMSDLKDKSDDLQDNVKEKVAEFETAMETLLDKARKVTEQFGTSPGSSQETTA